MRSWDWTRRGEEQHTVPAVITVISCEILMHIGLMQSLFWVMNTIYQQWIHTYSAVKSSREECFFSFAYSSEMDVHAWCVSLRRVQLKCPPLQWCTHKLLLEWDLWPFHLQDSSSTHQANAARLKWPDSSVTDRMTTIINSIYYIVQDNVNVSCHFCLCTLNLTDISHDSKRAHTHCNTTVVHLNAQCHTHMRWNYTHLRTHSF